jgi:hypothetical protein
MSVYYTTWFMIDHCRFYYFLVYLITSLQQFPLSYEQKNINVYLLIVISANELSK